MTTLRYFECAARGQPLRFALAEFLPDYVDERVPLGKDSGWGERRLEPDFGGPFATLPVLNIDGLVLSQALAIADYLTRKLGQEPADEATRMRHVMARTAAQMDVVELLTTLLWTRTDPAPALLARARMGKARAAEKLMQISALLPADASLFGGATPNVTDCFVFEAMRGAEQVFGEAVSEGAPKLRAHAELMRARPAIAAELSRIPARLTGSPWEAQVIEMVKSAPA